ncbi:rhodanese-like domain-containing protein [Arthrobacter sp. UYEF36]|uniref:rhodanese-like domain-containing protein n=1 Tax=Arthrobacter sp. UYEF36 TaxID=1756366 RepID=UPI0033996ED3
MRVEPAVIERTSRIRSQDPASVPRKVGGEPDLVVVDTTWGELQPLQCAPGVVTLGELELLELLGGGAVLVDSRVPGSRAGITIPGAVNLPHDRILEFRDQLDPSRLSVFFCNGPQCPQSPAAVRALMETGYPASALAYYRGGLHDWVTLAMPTERVT